MAGDDKYGDRERNEELRRYGLNRMFLHAASIGVDRPGTHEPLLVSAPLGADLHAVLEALLKAPGSRRGEARRRARSSGRPVSAVGSTDSMRSNSAMPSDSALKPPAQSSGASAAT